jgi:hypothetical protein
MAIKQINSIKQIGMLATSVLDLRFADYQELIINTILRKRVEHLLVVASRQAGKSKSIAAGIAMLAAFSSNEEILIIAPTKTQAAVIYKYVLQYVKSSTVLCNYVDFKKQRSLETLGNEISKERITFTNPITKETSTIFIMSAGGSGKGEGALGQSPTILVIDESQSIDDEAYNKILAMMASLKKTQPMIIEIGTAHNINHFYETWEENNGIKKVRVTCEDGITQSIMNAKFIAREKQRLSEVDFNRWYMGIFPTTGDKNIFNRAKVKAAMQRIVTPKTNVIDIGIDVARYGDDSTVVTAKQGFSVFYQKEHNKEGVDQTAGRGINLATQYVRAGYKVRVTVDDTGVGGGVTDIIKAALPEVEVYGVCNNNVAKDPIAYNDLITELWFEVSKIIDQIQLPNNKELITELSQRFYGYTLKGQKTIESKKIMKKRGLKSPDRADSLLYCFYPDIQQIVAESSFDAGFV